MSMSPGSIGTLAEMSPSRIKSCSLTLSCNSWPLIFRMIFERLPAAKSVMPPTAIMTSIMLIFSRYCNVWGLAACPMTRICWLYGPTKPITMTVTTGSCMYLASECSRSLAKTEGVFPAACMSETSGVDILPSGRTGMISESSGLCQTTILTLSPGPIM